EFPFESGHPRAGTQPARTQAGFDLVNFRLLDVGGSEYQEVVPVHGKSLITDHVDQRVWGSPGRSCAGRRIPSRSISSATAWAHSAWPSAISVANWCEAKAGSLPRAEIAVRYRVVARPVSPRSRATTSASVAYITAGRVVFRSSRAS